MSNLKMNNNINEVITDLYEDLIKLRYPGIAHKDINHFEESILSENNRCQLLHWILTQSYKAIDQTCDISLTDSTRLVQCYVDMGVCTNREALLGRGSVDSQLEALLNLRTFIFAVLMQAGEMLPAPTLSAWEIVQNYTENNDDSMPNISHLISDISANEAKNFIKNVQASRKNNLLESTKEENANEQKSSDTQDSVNEPPEEQLSTAVIDNFCKTFENINKLDDPDVPESNVSLDAEIDNLNTQFAKLNKTLKSRMELIDSQLPKVSEFKEQPLDSVIQNIAVALESLPSIDPHKK